MGVFEEVKRNVTVRQAAEFYGFKPNRSGLIRCIFHNDGTPSMKVDRRYYCFGCGCTGDVIDFTAQLFGLRSREAALKLADDFGISYENRGRDSPKNGKKSPVKEKRITPETDWKTECVRYTKAYLNYRTLLLEWKECYAPKTQEEEWNEHFVTALRELSIVEYYLDILLFGDEWDKKALLQEKRKEVERIEQECRKNIRHGETGCLAENGTDGGSVCRRGDPGTSGGDKAGNHQRDNAELHDRIKRRSPSQREPSL